MCPESCDIKSMTWCGFNRELKHRRFWATDVNRKFMFLLLARFHARPLSYKVLILGFTTWYFQRKGSNTHRKGEISTSGWRPWLKNVCVKLSNIDQGPVSRKSRELLGPEKPFVNISNRLFRTEPISCLHILKITKSKLTSTFDNLNLLRSWNTKGIVTPENSLKSFGTFEKRALGPNLGTVNT